MEAMEILQYIAPNPNSELYKWPSKMLTKKYFIWILSVYSLIKLYKTLKLQQH